MATRYSIEEMAALFAERERDGLSIAALSRRTGIHRKTLSRWERILADEDRDESSAFAEAALAPDQAESTPALRIRIGDATIDVSGPLGEALDAVVGVLLARC